MQPIDIAGPEANHVSPNPQVTLEITRGRARNRRREVRSQAFLIGSAHDNDLVLGDARFDELHSYIFLRSDKVTIRRLGVGPELRVEEQEVTTALLKDSDHLQLGPFEFQVSINWKAQPHPTLRPSQAVVGQTPLTIDNDPALERLLRDVESCSSSPVRLFVAENRKTRVESSTEATLPQKRRASF